MHKGIALGVLLASTVLACAAHAQQYDGVDAYEQYGKRVHAAQEVAPLTDALFGDQVSLYNGATTFAATDLALPGNDGLSVALARQLVIQDRRKQPMDGDGLPGFGDWNLDVPYIDGVFTSQNGWTLAPDGATDRCSDNVDVPQMAIPIGAGIDDAPYADVWGGNSLHVPGAGDQQLLANTQAKAPAYASASTWKWVTSGHWKLRCVASVTNMAGEGFVAVSPQGIQYTFDYAVSMPTSGYAWKYDDKLAPTVLARSRIYLLATHVQDRFGNWVNFSYSGNHLTSITASDGRSITVSWSGSTISSVTSALGTWSYAYGTASHTNPNGVVETWTYLSSVTRPDGSKWTYAVDSGSLVSDKNDWPSTDLLPHSHCQLQPLQNTGSFVYTIGAPSGAMATFTFDYLRHYRDDVPYACVNNANPDINYPQQVTGFFDNFALTNKQVSGPGLVTQVWSYDYTGIATAGYYTAPSPWNMDYTTEPYVPPGDCGCTASKTVTVTGPTSTTVYTYGIQYARNEGRLLATQVEGAQGNVLRTSTLTYLGDAQAPSQAFPDIAGQDILPNFQNPMGNRNRPVTQTVITQDGATFTTTTNSFDVFARGTSDTESSSLGYSKTDTTTYADDLNLWVLGLVTQSATDGIVTAQTGYDSLDRPISDTRFGKLVDTKAWNADGTLASVTDGDGHTTTLSNWYRGLPTKVTFADGTTKSATVNDAGWITSLTDENGFTTNYAYDPMGRLSQISYPTGDGVAWNPTQLSFAQVAGTEYGIPGGHWTQTVHTGNGYAVTYFDAFWRPLLTRHYDAGDQAATESDVIALYDAGGRKVYTSYPARGVTSYTQALPGTSTAYDALNRVTQVQQDTELGTSTTTTQYLAGLQTEVTDPRGFSSTTKHIAYGSPDGAQVAEVDAPSNETTTITRDVFGKPLAIARNGVVYDTLAYDAYQQLCKRIANGVVSFYGWDGAGNLAWSANGANGYADASCDDVNPTNAAGHVVTRTYDARNRLATLAFPDGNGNQSWTYTPDGLPAEVTTANLGVGTVTNDYLYDRRRLLIAEGMGLAGQPALAIGYGYDANAHLASRSAPSGQVYLRAPDALGEPTQLAVQGGGNIASNVTFLPDGHIQSYTLGNGLTHVLTENTRGLPGEIHDSAPGSDAEDLVYTYDADANPTLIADNAAGTRTATLHYDALGRLTSAAIAGIASDTPSNYSYNALDQLIEVQQGTHSRTYAYDVHYTDELTSITDSQLGTTAYTWDAQGNLASRAGQAFQFDVGNRLRGVLGSEAAYAYDDAGRRVSQTSAVGSIASFYDSAGKLVWQHDRDGNSHDDLYLGGKLIAIRDFDGTGTNTGTRYQHTDALGSVIAQTNASGTVIPGSAAIYDAWGGVHGATMQDGPGYTGHVEDAATGLVYMQQRYYDPNVGRFLSMDPVQADGGSGGNLDRYWYAADNPERNVDPDGRRMSTKGMAPCTGSHIGGGGCGAINLRRIQVGAPSLSAAKKAAAAAAATAAWERTGGDLLGDALRAAASGALEGLGAILTAPVTVGVVGVGLAMMPTSTAADDTPDAYERNPRRGMPVFRVCGGDSNCLTGRSWSPINPFVVRAAGENYRDVAGLPNRNLGRYVVRGYLANPAGVEQVREAAAYGTHGFVPNRGGLLEYVIPDPQSSIINMSVVPASPHF